MALTPAQKERIEKNRLAALQRKRSLDNSNANANGITSSSQSLSQDSQTSNNSNNSSSSTTNGSHKKYRASPRENPYRSSPAKARPPPSPVLSQEEREARNNRERKARESALIPPLPGGSPKLRDVTVNSLSEQQLEVIKLARPPTSSSNDDINKGYMVRVTAAAGTGKTTTLLHLAVRCLDLGHDSVTYVTFSKASAMDAKQRILQMMQKHQHAGDGGDDEQRISASTLHSCAMKLVAQEMVDGDNLEKGLMDDNILKNVIRQQYDKEIEAYVSPAVDHVYKAAYEKENADQFQSNLKKYRQKGKIMKDQVVYYILKTFQHFLQSRMTLEEFKDDTNRNRHYYPVAKFDFKHDGKASKLGFPPDYALPESYRFYADISVKLWEYVVQSNNRSYDIEMKKAQLNNLRIPCSVLLVDECQDLDGCQVAFIAKQIDFGAQVFFVGDAAQSLYYFRGARTHYVMDLPDCVDRAITKSWRFGPAIAKIANITLLFKKHSPQTNCKTKNWEPYLVEAGKSDHDSVVIPNSLSRGVSSWNKRPVTIIAWKNATLLRKALDLMNLEHLVNEQRDMIDELLDPSESKKVEKIEEDYDSLMENMPKICINGKGEVSGAKGWAKTIKQIEHLHQLFMAREDGGSLPHNLFPEFADDDKMTWSDFVDAYKLQELTNYTKAVEVVMTYGKNTIEAVRHFQAQLNRKYTENEADFILATCHSAKGLEWDHVELCDDFIDLFAESYICNIGDVRGLPFLASADDCEVKHVRRWGWQFNGKEYGDDLNMLYVACTRARKTLALPKSIKDLLCHFDDIHFYVNDMKNCEAKPKCSDDSMFMYGKENKKLNKGEVWNLYQDLVVPFRKMLDVEDDSKIMKSLFGVEEEEGIEEDNVKVKSEEQSQVFEC